MAFGGPDALRDIVKKERMHIRKESHSQASEVRTFAFKVAEGDTGSVCVKYPRPANIVL